MLNRGPDVTELYAEHGDDLLQFLVRRTGDAEIAADLWGETFAQALASRGRFRGNHDQAIAWLYTIARRQLGRYYRRGNAECRAMQRLGMERPAVSAEAEAQLVRRAGLDEMRDAIAEGVAMLSDDAREAIMLRVVQELPYSDLASRLAISEQAARLRVSRGMRMLARVLDVQDVDASRLGGSLCSPLWRGLSWRSATARGVLTSLRRPRPRSPPQARFSGW
jgi:RNA polymerase sigma factor (sigma-70 family)